MDFAFAHIEFINLNRLVEIAYRVFRAHQLRDRLMLVPVGFHKPWSKKRLSYDSIRAGFGLN
jgi:hypothetical protein